MKENELIQKIVLNVSLKWSINNLISYSVMDMVGFIIIIFFLIAKMIFTA